MPQIKRRHFLQFAGSTLAALGLSQWDVIGKSDRYAQVLAQSTNRKLALLVGINTYPGGDTLSGCVMDVNLQRELLIHRFGFNQKDILVVTDKQATRQGILAAFEEHLIQQAKPGDVAVFHYSGHGSQVADPESGEQDGLNSTFVPADNNLSLTQRLDGGVVPDITGGTLFLLMSALQTDNFTAVLDSCHSGGGKRGSLTVRALEGGPQLKRSPQEAQYQQQLLSRLKMSPEEFKKRRQAGVAKGVVIASANRRQLAADARFSGFAAGAFTYVMTQYLWQATGDQSLSSAIANIARSTTQASSTAQVPEYEAKSGGDRQPVYFLTKQAPPAEGVITKVDGDKVELWLGGVNSQSIRAFDKGALFTLVDPSGKDIGQVQVEPNSRKGLIAKGKLKDSPSSLPTGTLLQERARGIPTDLSLRIGLDSSLGSDREPFAKAIKAMKRIEVVSGNDEVSYLLGKVTAENQKFQKAAGEDFPATGSIGVFSPALDIIPGSFGPAGETVAEASTRLKAKFKSLLAARMVRMILNPGSSRLNVSVSMTPAGGKEVLASAFAARGVAKGEGNSAAKPVVDSKQLPVGTPLEFSVTNNEKRDLHVSVLVIDPTGDMTVIFPNSWVASEDATIVKAGETLAIPDMGKDKFRLTVQKPLGTIEVLAIASATPLTDALKALQGIASRGGQRGGPVDLGDDPPEVINHLLDDLNQGTRGIAVEFDSNARGVSTTQLAAMSITFEVIAS